MRARQAVLIFALLAVAAPASAHPAPFSYLDLHLRTGRVEIALVAHAIDLAHELNLASPDQLRDRRVVDANRDRMAGLLRQRLDLAASGATLEPVVDGIDILADRQALRFSLHAAVEGPPASLVVHAALFPYDANHQTFVNVYEGDTLKHQGILNAARTSLEYFPGNAPGVLTVVRRFVAEGARHIAIGPDHLLFLIGLLLLGGSLMQLVRIVTAFTVAHSLTLTLAVLDILSPSPRLVEPAIALSIIYIGADNLLVTRESRDARAWIALAFGLIHGFGFASVLREMDLPRQALGWSLFSFNAGVEIGQVAIVLVVASALALARRSSEALGRRLVYVGSAGVMAAGAYWFVERVFFSGGV
jgi:hydrogenase/urease accessory protein HupE